jgi:hypothetical protein
VTLEQLGAVHPADAGIERRQRERIGPLPGGLGPLGGPAQVAELVAGIHQAAVDRAGPQRPELVGQRREHRFVEQCQPVGDAGLLDPDPAFEIDTQGRQRGVVVPSTQVLHPSGGCFGDAEVARHERGGAEVEGIPVSCALRKPFEDPVSPADPPCAL